MTRFPNLTGVQQIAADTAFGEYTKGIVADLEAEEATDEYVIGYQIGQERAEEWLVQQVRFGDGAYRR